jgi:hypothetical protein
MMRLANAGSVVQAAVALGLALIAAPIVRGLTSELGDTVGQAWPFSLARCTSAAPPGCDHRAERSAERQPGVHIRTGRL